MSCPTFAAAASVKFSGGSADARADALRYGGPQIRVVLANSEDGTCIQVRDNGTGVPAESEQYIFDAYYRVPNQSPHAASIGLGLAVSRDLARLMGGDLTYRHHEGETIFELRPPPADRN